MIVSIIIAVKTWQKNLEECVVKCLELDYPDFEIIVLPDDSLDSVLGYRFSVFAEHRTLNTEHQNMGPFSKLRIIPTGPIGPPHKRDIGAKHAKGDILAFIDDDAYPSKDWIKNAVEIFQDKGIAAVGGPGITPDTDTLMQKAGGSVYASFLVSARFIYRYLPKKEQEVDDYPSCNLLVRKSVMEEVGGFDTNFWPGEDTKLCLDITKKLKLRIVYAPNVIVYHHRRPLFLPHLKQVANYALHRGYFVKRYPQTSFKLAYFIPSVFVCGLIIGAVLSLAFLSIKQLYLFVLALYLFLVSISSIYQDFRLIPLVFFGIISTHLVYGFYFLKGIFSAELSDSK